MTKQEQIEEILHIICGQYKDGVCAIDKNNCDKSCSWAKDAEALYNAGYRKIDDNCEVITKDDLNIYKKQVVKDTAKEICNLILEHWKEKQFIECDWLRVAIAEKYGVEVEE